MEGKQSQKMKDCIILGGSSHPDLVRRICDTLDIDALPLEAKNFSNGETAISIGESVRDKDVFVVQTSFDSVNDYLMELLIVVSALKIASAKSVTAVLPLFPYSRQIDARRAQTRAKSLSDDSKAATDAVHHAALSPRKASTFGEEVRTRESTPLGSHIPELGYNSQSLDSSSDKSRGDRHAMFFSNRAPGALGGRSSSLVNPEFNSGMRTWIARSGSLIASLLTTAGVDHVITMDLHDPQFQGFFDVPFDNLLFRPLLIDFIQQVIPAYHSAVIVSPDAGGAKRATAVADLLHTRFALIHQDRRNNATILVGDVTDRVAIIVDDLLDTGHTLMRAAKIVKDHGAVQVYAIATHGVFSGDTLERIKESAIDMMVTTNSVPQDHHQDVLGRMLQVVDVSKLFAEAIRRVYNGESISRLYQTAPINL